MTDQAEPRAPEEKICAYEYTVKRGDSFYLIAHRLGVPLRDLLDANSDINPARLTVGDVLCIPLEEDDRVQEDTTAQEPITTEQVRPNQVQPEPTPETTEVPDVTLPNDTSVDEPAHGEEASPDTATCDSVTLETGETVTDVQLARGLSWHTLSEANPNVDLENLSQGASLCVPETNTPCPLPLMYTVANGETLESVALRFNVSISALLRANPCLAPADFTEGAEVVLPQN